MVYILKRKSMITRTTLNIINANFKNLEDIFILFKILMHMQQRRH